MCLIVYAPDGELIERRVFDYAATQNSDGIGVMSVLGIERFVGRKSRKRAWRAIRKAATARVAYGVHFRWATHGDVNLANCHPYENGDGDTLVMHNGVLRATSGFATKEKSDTRVFVDYFMKAVPAPSDAVRPCFLRLITEAMGADNKFLIFHRPTGTFELLNADAGFWIDSVWYSNGYSLPGDMDPDYGKAYLKSTGAASLTPAERARTLGLPFANSQRAHYRAALAGGNEYEDRNVSDAYERDPYYAAMRRAEGYYDDGAELGTRAAMRADGRSSTAMRLHDEPLTYAEQELADAVDADALSEIELIESLNDEELTEEDKEWVAGYLADMKNKRAAN